MDKLNVFLLTLLLILICSLTSCAIKEKRNELIPYKNYVYVAAGIDETTSIKIIFEYIGDLEKLKSRIKNIALLKDNQNYIVLEHNNLKREEWGGNQCYIIFKTQSIEVNKIEINYINGEKSIFDLGFLTVERFEILDRSGGLNFLSIKPPCTKEDSLYVNLVNRSTQLVKIKSIEFKNMSVFYDDIVVIQDNKVTYKNKSKIDITLSPTESVELKVPLDQEFIERLGETDSDFFLNFQPKLNYSIGKKDYSVIHFGGSVRINIY